MRLESSLGRPGPWLPVAQQCGRAAARKNCTQGAGRAPLRSDPGALALERAFKLLPGSDADVPARLEVMLGVACAEQKDSRSCTGEARRHGSVLAPGPRPDPGAPRTPTSTKEHSAADARHAFDGRAPRVRAPDALPLAAAGRRPAACPFPEKSFWATGIAVLSAGGWSRRWEEHAAVHPCVGRRLGLKTKPLGQPRW